MWRSEEISELLPDGTVVSYHAFARCRTKSAVFWKGSLKNDYRIEKNAVDVQFTESKLGEVVIEKYQ